MAHHYAEEFKSKARSWQEAQGARNGNRTYPAARVPRHFGYVDRVLEEDFARQPEYRVLPEPLTSEPIGIGIRQEDVALKDMIQKTLDEMFADGTMKKISIKWFGDDITSWK